MSERNQTKVELDGATLHVKGNRDEEVHIGPGGIRIRDGDEEVRVGWTGVRICDGGTRVRISLWKPLVGCGVAILVLAALVTLVVVGIVRLAMP